MPWKFDFTKNFRDKLKAMPHKYQKIQTKEKLLFVKDLEHPKDDGAPYMHGWSYIFGTKGILQCDIDEENMIIIFTNIIP